MSRLDFFKIVPVHKFLFGLEWSPQIAIHAEQIGSSGAFRVVPILFGTMLIAGIAMCVACATRAYGCHLSV